MWNIWCGLPFACLVGQQVRQQVRQQVQQQGPQQGPQQGEDLAPSPGQRLVLLGLAPTRNDEHTEPLIGPNCLMSRWVTNESNAFLMLQHQNPAAPHSTCPAFRTHRATGWANLALTGWENSAPFRNSTLYGWFCHNLKKANGFKNTKRKSIWNLISKCEATYVPRARQQGQRVLQVQQLDGAVWHLNCPNYFWWERGPIQP